MINTLFSLYEKKSQGDKEAEILIELRNFFTSIIQSVGAFDPTTGISLSTNLDDLLKAINDFNSNSSPKCTKDYLYKISDFCLGAFNDLYKQMKEESVRTHQVMPVYRVRELDSSDMIALNRRPGRNIKEKLSGRPFMQAVKRNMSCDILENRLLKEFAYRMRELLETREKALKDSEDSVCNELLFRTDKFLHLEICDDILDWNNAMQNNVLLQDKVYGKIWKAWKEINSIDDYIEYDSVHIDLFLSLYLFWSILGKLSQYKNFHFIQQPVNLDYQNIQISPVFEVTGYSDANSTNIVTWTFKFLKNSFIISNSLNQRISVSISNRSIFVNQKEIVNENISLNELKTVYNFYADWIHKGDINSNKKSEPITNIDSISFDLYSARPFYAVDGRLHGQMNQIFLIQNWNINEEHYFIPLTNSDACYVSKNKDKIRTDSLISLLEASQEETEKNIENASLLSMKLFQSVSEQFKCSRIHLVVPDSVSDFALQPIRKNANAVFLKVYTVPRSIGSVFKFQASKEFEKANLKDGDFVFVLDRTKNYLSITPVQAETHNSLKGKGIPRNIRWVKHPSTTIRLDNSSELNDLLANKIPEANDFWDSLNPGNMQKDFASFGIVNDSYEKEVFIENKNTINQINQVLRKQSVSKADIYDARAKCAVKNTSKCYVIKASDWIYFSSDVICNNTSFNPVEGSGILSEWQKQIPEVTLWREHLPKLLMKVQLPKPINLCYNQEVEPIFGKKIKLQDIKIPLVDGSYGEIFGLRAGQESYQFPLVIGDGSAKVKYQAELRSPAFPLDEDLDCKLDMYYTYGKDNPFELEFIPINNKAVTPISVEWTLFDSKNQPIVYPEFPPKPSFEELQNFKSINKPEGENLFNWAEEQLENLTKTLNSRRDAEELYGWFTKIDKKGNRFGFITSRNARGNIGPSDDIYIHELAFEDKELQKFNKCHTISYDLLPYNKGKYKAVYISAGYSLSNFRLQKIPSQLYFPLLTIFGNYSFDSLPDNYKEYFESKVEGIKEVRNWYLGKEYSIQTTEMLFSLLCCFGDVSWNYTKDEILSYLKKTKSFVEYNRDIAFALGTVSLAEQKVVINEVVKMFVSNSLEDLQINPFNSVLSAAIYILSSVMWKNEDIVLELPSSQIPVLFYGTKQFLDVTVNKIDVLKRYTCQTINAALELLLGLLRYRQLKIEGVNKVLGADNPEVKTLVNHLNKIDKKIKEADSMAERMNMQQNQTGGNRFVKGWPKTRLNFGDLPQKGNKDALCYVLEAYLKEEELTSQIVIKGFTESE